MPTANPRVNVTLSPSLDLLVTRMSVATRTSKAQVLRELLEAAEPALQRAVNLMEAATKASQAVKESLSKGLDKAQSDAEKAAATVLARLDGAAADLVAQAEAIRERRPQRMRSTAAVGAPGSPRSGRNPPASNRGVKSSGAKRSRGQK